MNLLLEKHVINEDITIIPQDQNHLVQVQNLPMF